MCDVTRRCLLSVRRCPVPARCSALSDKADLTEAAARLFAGFRHLDADAAALGLTRIAVMPVPNHGLGRAINDRMCRAAKRRA